MVGLSVSVNTEIKSVSDTVWKINHVCVILLYIPEYVCHVIKKKNADICNQSCVKLCNGIHM